MITVKQLIGQFPVVRPIARAIYRALMRNRISAYSFSGSAAYWENRYSSGGTSGAGSYGGFARFKAEVLNSFVARNKIETVVEFGCGDGNQLTLAEYPRYLGIDVSNTAIDHCRKMFREDTTKVFLRLDEYSGETATLSLSLDVIYHLVEDDVFESYMRRLFDSSTRFVIIYSSNTEKNVGHANSHIRHRKITAWVEKNADNWNLTERIPNRYPYDSDHTKGSFSDFYFFERQS